MTDKKKKRVGVFSLKFREADGTTHKEEFGAMFDSPFPGSYSASLTLQTGKEGKDGYPERERVVAVKTDKGRTLDISEAFVNFVAYEDMPARPPRT